MGDTFGKLFQVTTWGESHGSAMGTTIVGCPPGIDLGLVEESIALRNGDSSYQVPIYSSPIIQQELDRRRPGQSVLTTPRKEQDKAYFLSGIFQGRTTGAPINALCWNSDHRSQDYDSFKNIDRPGHAGFTYRAKYGIYDYRGGGRSSYRETWGRVVAGAIAKMYLKQSCNIEVLACVSQIGNVSADIDWQHVTQQHIEAHPTRCPVPASADQMQKAILNAMQEGDSLGGAIQAIARGVPIGLGEPVFDKLDADLFKALKSIHATKAIEIGLGQNVAQLKGSQHNDVFFVDDQDHLRPRTNYAGGVLGGISSGEDILLRVVFKPTATIKKPQETVNIDGEKTVLTGAGRHDPCVLPRAVVTVESMIALVLMDHYLRHRGQCG